MGIKALTQKMFPVTKWVGFNSRVTRLNFWKKRISLLIELQVDSLT